MAEHTIKFDNAPESVFVQTGTLISEAAQHAGVEIVQPCGGQGRCGRCAVVVTDGEVRRRSNLRLSSADVESGYALACQSVIEADIEVRVPPQEKIERRLTTDLLAAEVIIPHGYDPEVSQTIRRIPLTLSPATLDDQTDDWSRVGTALSKQADIHKAHISLHMLQKLGSIVRESDWQVTALVNTSVWDCPDCPAKIIELFPGHIDTDEPLWGIAIDIGTTTVSVWLVNLNTGKVEAQVAEYNQQISRGEDVISRIIYSSKDNGKETMRVLVVDTINQLIVRACKRKKVSSVDVVKATISGNSTMIHLLLEISASSIRLAPFVTTVNNIPTLSASEVGLHIHPNGIVDCLPGVASYVGADISAGVLSSGLDDDEIVTLFMDVGTNGEIVLGSSDWLIACACSAGPAFEGSGVLDGMRATKGAIEEVWINSTTYEPTVRVIGNVQAKGLCGSGLISLLAELFLTGLVDKGGSINADLDTNRVRQGDHGSEYVIVWAKESAHGNDIVITNVDIDNLLRAKAAIYAGFSVLTEGVGFPLESVDQVLIGGSFGKYINVEKAIEIGLLPDMPWKNFRFLGNTSVKGAYLALIDFEMRQRVKDIAERMTYVELSADNKFYDAFMSALFLPHTDLSLFPSIKKVFEQ